MKRSLGTGIGLVAVLLTATLVLRRPGSHSRDVSAARPGMIVFRDGDETDPREHGRPVALVAAAPGVPDQVFRDAFSHVRPARGGSPTPARARANKKVLMQALGPYGVTNRRLDEVSDYYRCNRSRGEHWPHTPAAAVAVIQGDSVTGISITNPGSGYSSPPRVRVAGYPQVRVTAHLALGTDLRTNGRITALRLVNP